MTRVLPRRKPSCPARATPGVHHAPPEQPRAAHARLRGEPRAGRARSQAADPHARSADLLGQGLGKGQHIRLGRAVNRLIRAGREGGRGGDVQERARMPI